MTPATLAGVSRAAGPGLGGPAAQVGGFKLGGRGGAAYPPRGPSRRRGRARAPLAVASGLPVPAGGTQWIAPRRALPPPAGSRARTRQCGLRAGPLRESESGRGADWRAGRPGPVICQTPAGVSRGRRGRRGRRGGRAHWASVRGTWGAFACSVLAFTGTWLASSRSDSPAIRARVRVIISATEATGSLPVRDSEATNFGSGTSTGRPGRCHWQARSRRSLPVAGDGRRSLSEVTQWGALLEPESDHGNLGALHEEPDSNFKVSLLGSSWKSWYL